MAQPPSPDFADLRVRARELIAAGKLPATTDPFAVEGTGVGNATRCGLCELTIEKRKIGFTVTAPGAGSERQRYPAMHFLCHAAWQLEAAEAEAAAPPTAPGQKRFP
jgi:acetamidase/formamidase